MRLLVIKAVVAVTLILIIYTITLLVPVKSDRWLVAHHDKHVLLSQQDSPKIIFVGGSNLPFGLDSQLVEETTGVPVVNMGLKANIGLRFMLEEVKHAIKPNDIIVIVPEYEHFYGDLLDGTLTLIWALQIRPQSIQYITSYEQLLTIITNMPYFIGERVDEILNFKRDLIYTRDGFNQHGDFIGHFDKEGVDEFPDTGRIRNKPDNKDTILVIQEFVNYTTQKGATVYYIYPPMANTQYQIDDNRHTLQDIHQQLVQINNLSIAQTPSDFIYPDTLFFDTRYHLNKGGRQIWSETVAQYLLSNIDTP